MKRRWKRKLIILAALATLGFALLNVIAYRQAYTMMHFSASGERTAKPEKLSLVDKAKLLFTGINMPRTVCDIEPSRLHPACEEVSITDSNSITLSAWYVDQGANTPLVILFHGYSSDKTAHILEAQAFLELGASVMLVDFRGSGGSSESYTTIGVHEAEDVATVVKYAEAQFQHSALILFGQSMGSASILRAVAVLQIEPDGVILEANFDTLLNAIRNRFAAMSFPSFPAAELMVLWGGCQSDFNGFTHRPVDYAASLNCPSLFMHGEDDPRAKASEAKRVFDVVTAPKELIVFPDTGHNAYIVNNREEWLRAVQRLLASAQSKGD